MININITHQEETSLTKCEEAESSHVSYLEMFGNEPCYNID